MPTYPTFHHGMESELKGRKKKKGGRHPKILLSKRRWKKRGKRKFTRPYVPLGRKERGGRDTELPSSDY